MSDPDTERAARQAKHAVQLALVCVLVAVVVLLIDSSIKRAILAARDEALLALENLNITARQVIDGQQADEPGRSASVAAGDAGGSVVDAAAAGPAVAAAAGDVDFAPPAGRAGGAGGPRGDGG